jgi:hypothetical protein
MTNEIAVSARHRVWVSRFLLFVVVSLISCLDATALEPSQLMNFEAEVVSITPINKTSKPQFIVNYPSDRLIGLKVLSAIAGHPEYTVGSVIFLAVYIDTYWDENNEDIQIGKRYSVHMEEGMCDDGPFWDAVLKRL